MGQSNSRVHPSRSLSTSSTPARGSNPAPPPVEHIGAASSEQSTPQTLDVPNMSKRTQQRSSLRRSVLGLVSRSSSSNSPSTSRESDSTHHDQPSQSLRKRWRSSRRLSKAPSVAQSDDVAGSSKEPQTETTAMEEVTEETVSPSAAEAGTSGVDLRNSRPSTPFPVSRPTSRPTTPRADPAIEADAEVLSDEERQLSQNIGTWLSGAGPLSSSSNSPSESSGSAQPHPTDEGIEQEITEYLSTPSDGGNYADGILDNSASSSTEPAQAAPEPTVQPTSQPRHFPPPGTLVVVQGVVNTTDAPQGTAPTSSTSRPSHTSASPHTIVDPPSTIPTIRHHRSASVPRSSHRSQNYADERQGGLNALSSLLPRPRSMINRRPSSGGGVSTLQASNLNSDSLPTSNHDRSSTDNSQPSESQNSSPTESDTGHRALSSGSIDVLGTLLSVAAAATAASLFSPGLAQSGNFNSQNRPLSPTPTAGLGGFGGLNGLAGLGFDPSSNPSAQQPDRDARDRIRNVWENFRERLGLGPRGTTNAPGSMGDGQAEGGDSATGANTRMRPGELMLAEMARALNAGLGLTSQNERQSSDQGTTPESQSTGASGATTNGPPLAPDAGFETFLLNLQADLRTVLSDGGSVNRNGTNEIPNPFAPPPEPIATEDVVPTSSVTNLREDAAADDDDMPSLATVSDSSDEEDSEDEDGNYIHNIMSDVRSHPRTPTPIPSSTLPHAAEQPAASEGGASRGAGDRPRPAINLWRIHRFQPIPAPPQVVVASTNPSSLPVTPSPPVAETTSSAPVEVSTPNTDSEPVSLATPIPEADAGVVIPVIVVGLQSVDIAIDREHALDDEFHHDGAHDAAQDDGMLGGGNGRPATPRGRTWQTRAANALRTLRPGRRAGSQSGRTAEGTGSRTFLIYVIGGYYPPNHHMVTGSESLDSYEALWELAELLGQVKPPTASKADIDNSGLLIIKGNELTQYERDGKVSSNCVDRCLVCLDEYESEDSIRVMSCKHAFHKDCVDKWLQVGRNNCPACRTKGVSTSNESGPTPPSPLS